jgi:hypothetical protein
MKRHYFGATTAIIAAVCIFSSTAAASIFSYQADLNGLAESPPNASPGTGSALIDYDNALHTMRVQVSFSDLLGMTTASHIHSPTASPGTGTAGVATQTPTFINFPLGITSGSYDHTFDLTEAASYNASYVTAHGGTAAGAEADLTASFAAGTSYLNIHTSVVPGGEIRGFLTPVPEPGMFALGATGVLCLWFIKRARR